MNQKELRLLWLFLLVISISMAAEEQRQYKGTLNSELQPGQATQTIQLASVPAETVSKLPNGSVEGAEVLAGTLDLTKSKHFVLVAVVPQSGPKHLYVDLNGDGKFDASERVVMSDKGEAEVNLPYQVGKFTAIPAKLVYVEPTSRNTPSAAIGQKTLRATLYSSAIGTVEIGGQRTLFKYNLSLQNRSVDPTRGQFWVDCDGNGKFGDFRTEENGQANGEPWVFRVGKHYVATKSVDVNTGEIVIEERSASEYKRIELLIGSEIPDFPFTDFEGKSRRLSDYRGKYLLLDFWGTW